MAFRRLIYALTLAGVLLFQITNENYLAHFLLCLCIALPLLSLALSLPGMLGCALELSAVPAASERGQPARWLMSIESPTSLPLSRLNIRLTEENLLTGQRQSHQLILSGIARRRPMELAASTAHCGLLELRADRAKVYDYLGLFRMPVAVPHSARILCLPVPAEAELPAIPEGQGSRPSPLSAARTGPGEDYDLREYRPGDPMRSVHWKLSSKWDELIVRERAETLVPLPLLTLDRFGDPEELDRLLDRLLGVSRALLGVQRAHAVLWLDGDGRPQLHTVSDEKQLTDCLLSLLGTPAPAKGPALDDLPDLPWEAGAPVFRLHITLEGGDGRG